MSPPRIFEADNLRAALLVALPEEFSQYTTEPPEPKTIYIPQGHARALSESAPLVEGMRGAGKTLWWSSLQSARHREALREWFSPSVLPASLEVSAGFGAPLQPDQYPGRDMISRLLRSYDPRHIWRAVVLQHIRPDAGDRPGWEARVAWAQENPESVDRSLVEEDRRLLDNNRRRLLLFDALDQTADSRAGLRQMLRGLLQVLLELRALRALRAKAFLRPDMLTSDVMDFPDASKLNADRVQLRWEKKDLFALLWHLLANALSPHGELFRQECSELFQLSFHPPEDRIWKLPFGLFYDERKQRDVFHGLTGPLMGGGKERGFPFNWLPSHLADAHGKVSPRSFLLALRRAAENTFSIGEFALSPEGLKIGVQEASRQRIEEIQEDYPWIRAVMAPLEKLSIPAFFEEIEERWLRDGVLERLEKMEDYQRPGRLAEGFDGLRRDLLMMGVFLTLEDARINMPDVYRIGFGLVRKGGVKPVSLKGEPS